LNPVALKTPVYEVKFAETEIGNNMDYQYVDDEGLPYLKVALTDYALMSNSLLNKGMAFTHEERAAFGLLGLLPPHITDIDTQCERSYLAFKSKPNAIEQYIYMRDLQDSNETLFYNLIEKHIEEFLPIVYTPTVGLGCQRFSHVYRRPRGIFIAYPYHHEIDKILANARLACAGIHPASTLPILLDTGTNNTQLQNDPLYIGWRHERIRGADYDHFIEAFVNAIKKRFPHVLLHWEDFAQANANPILEHYRDQLCTFNDDIQGTAAVAAGALFAAIHITGVPLQDQRIVVFGAGSAGCGISNLIMEAMIEDGLSQEEAKKRFFLIDRVGLLTEDMTTLLPFQKPFAQSRAAIAQWKCENPHNITLAEVIRNVHPNLLVGVSGQPGVFTEDIVREMAADVDQPIIFPLSNPTERCEARPADIMRWTNDKAIISTGSPFPDIIKNGKTFRIDQTNNCYIFPGVGLGLIATKAKRITDKMFMVAAKALANASPTKNDPHANLLPPLSDIRQVSLQVALAVAKEAISSGLAGAIPVGDLEEYIRSCMWKPEYLPYRKK
jgi:malate dehydrogenase (oxaloacetate-decarboxylating)